MIRTLLLPCWLFMSLLAPHFVCGQDGTIRNPLPVEPSLSGNYGELRPNHFHAGLDLKTAGREGLDVMAAGEGHVSRIKISPYGYGKALYIDHPNGTTTVYGHLQRYSPEITAYIKEYQVKQKSFEIDIYPGEEDLPVTAGQVVAISGNTGGSGGPHLHFEVRETASEVPRNPIVMGFPISDTKPPVIDAIGIAPIGLGSRVRNSEKTAHARVSGSTLATTMPIEVEGTFGIEVNGYDSQSGSYNHNGIFRVDLIVDDSLISRFTADSISFDQSRHLNSLIDYPYYYSNRQRFMRMYRQPGNHLENLAYKSDGILNLSDGVHTIQVIAYDHEGNKDEVHFDVDISEGEGQDAFSSAEMLEWNIPYFYEAEDCKLFFPNHTVYASIPLNINQEDLGERPFVHVFDPWIPVQEAFEIKLRIPESMPREGLLIAQTNSAGRPSRALSSTVDGDWVRALSRNFGDFTLVTDDKAPTISMVNFKQGHTWNSGRLKFVIKDNFSGIQRYDAYVNGQWVIMEFEPKQDLVFIDVNDLPHSEEQQELRIEISDMAGNVATFEGTLKHP